MDSRGKRQKCGFPWSPHGLFLRVSAGLPSDRRPAGASGGFSSRHAGIQRGLCPVAFPFVFRTKGHGE